MRISTKTFLCMCFTVAFLALLTITGFAQTPVWSTDGPHVFTTGSVAVSPTAPFDPKIVGSTPELTVALWVKCPTLGGSYTLIDKTPTDANGLATGFKGWVVKLRNTGELWVRVGSNGIINAQFAEVRTGFVDSARIHAGVRAHIAFTFGNGTLKVYINGALVAKKDGIPFSTANTTIPMQIGMAKEVSTGDKTMGTIDGVKIYDQVLTGAQIATLVNRQLQTITFPAIPVTAPGVADFDPGAASSTAMPITYFSSAVNVASIVNNQIHPLVDGITTITAIQKGDVSTAPVLEDRVLVVKDPAKQAQTITFPALPTDKVATNVFAAGASASSGLAITYTNPRIGGNLTTGVATLTGAGQITVVGPGVAIIQASQAGDGTYTFADVAAQPLVVLSAARAAQTLTFPAIPSKYVGDPEFYNLGITSNIVEAANGSRVGFDLYSSNQAVAIIVNNTIRIVGPGTTQIIATHPGTASTTLFPGYTAGINAAAAVQTLTVLPNAFLGSISYDFGSGAVAVPSFNRETLTYNVSLPFGTTAIPVVTYTKSEANATVSITQPTSVTGTATLVVTSQDGSATKTYTVNFSVLPEVSSNANLSGITLSEGTLSPVFSPDVLTYSVELPYSAAVVPTVTPAKANVNATIQQTNAAVLPGTTTIKVTAQDGSTTKTYTVNFTKVAPKTISTLSDIKVNNTTITGFSASTITYNVVFPAGTTTLPTVTYTTTDADATVAKTDITAFPGTTTLVVTAQDGTTKTTYTINFTVAAPTGIGTINAGNFKFSPVPVASILNVEVPEGWVNGQMLIYNLNGSLLMKQVIDKTQIEADFTGLPTGVYYVKMISTTGLLVVEKVVK